MVHKQEEETRPYEKKQNWFDAQLLKVSLACFTFIAPIAISFFVWIAGIDKRLTIVEEKQNIIVEMRDDIKKMNGELVKIQLQLAAMNRGGN